MTLTHRAYPHSIIVMGRTADGQWIDLTSQAAFQSSDEKIAEVGRLARDLLLGPVVGKLGRDRRRRRFGGRLGRRLGRHHGCHLGRHVRRDGGHRDALALGRVAALAGQGLARDHQVVHDLGIVGGDRQGALVVGDGEVGEALGGKCVAAPLEGVGVFRVEADGGVEIGDRLMDQAHPHVDVAAIGEGPVMVGLEVDGGAEIGQGRLEEVQAGVGQAALVQHLPVARVPS